MNGREFFQLARHYWRADRAFAYASRQNIIGQEFGWFGKKMGWSLIRKAKFSGIRWVLVPVNITRYFEFAFVAKYASLSPQKCLDVSSPGLFSLYFASNNPDTAVRMMNPDKRDIDGTAAIAELLHIPNLHLQNGALDQIMHTANRYDCIWSISVLEHIAGEYDDRQSMQMLYSRLRKGGRLLVTVPVDREYWIEYRDKNHYGTQRSQGGKYFFQRFYDEAAIWDRLIAPIEREPSELCWFGERERGHFQDYIQRWLKEGLDCIVDDPREIVDHYQLFDDWSSMPGIGVCGLVIDKP